MPTDRNLPNWLQSSVDPNKISLTIKGAAVMIPAVVLLASYFGLHVSPESLGEALNQLAVAASAAVTVYGLVRKLWQGETDGN